MRMSKLTITFLLTLPMLVVSLPTQADSWKNESGHGRGKRADKWEERYEYQSAKAGPPPWAPAHGYRNKQRRGGQPADHYEPAGYHEEYVGVTEAIGINGGTCDREALGTVLGGVVGGVIGSKIGDGDGRKLAVIAGTVMGALVGRQIGRDMDKTDQQCVGQALERAADGHAIRWRNELNGLAYEVTPLKTYERDGRYCREYTTGIKSNNNSTVDRGTACRNADGTWSGV